MGVSDTEHLCFQRFHQNLRETKDPTQFRMDIVDSGHMGGRKGEFWTNDTFRDRKGKPEDESAEKFNFKCVEFASGFFLFFDLISIGLFLCLKS